MCDESVMSAQQVCTVGDMHTMSVMLDAHYIMDRYIPSEAKFGEWLDERFKENNLK